ncbi:hypothetical protein K461DRAFT_283211 [Myriangium duriaei CBS 260.36]|uniref:JmjC domain-containing protein n=1 Tax=Myriangium duriaei CBS 260.36 TaxID=1168546 RepID=A0A9P4IT12_9PEZI|nr:hypothetical protein K461DRAFT_283211 [Myriangium duriaei CBS 260.36]
MERDPGQHTGIPAPKSPDVLRFEDDFLISARGFAEDYHDAISSCPNASAVFQVQQEFHGILLSLHRRAVMTAAACKHILGLHARYTSVDYRDLDAIAQAAPLDMEDLVDRARYQSTIIANWGRQIFDHYQWHALDDNRVLRQLEQLALALPDWSRAVRALNRELTVRHQEVNEQNYIFMIGEHPTQWPIKNPHLPLIALDIRRAVRQIESGNLIDPDDETAYTICGHPIYLYNLTTDRYGMIVPTGRHDMVPPTYEYRYTDNGTTVNSGPDTRSTYTGARDDMHTQAIRDEVRRYSDDSQQSRIQTGRDSDSAEVGEIGIIQRSEKQEHASGANSNTNHDDTHNKYAQDATMQQRDVLSNQSDDTSAPIYDDDTRTEDIPDKPPQRLKSQDTQQTPEVKLQNGQNHTNGRPPLHITNGQSRNPAVQNASGTDLHKHQPVELDRRQDQKTEDEMSQVNGDNLLPAQESELSELSELHTADEKESVDEDLPEIWNHDSSTTNANRLSAHSEKSTKINDETTSGAVQTRKRSRTESHGSARQISTNGLASTPDQDRGDWSGARKLRRLSKHQSPVRKPSLASIHTAGLTNTPSRKTSSPLASTPQSGKAARVFHKAHTEAIEAMDRVLEFARRNWPRDRRQFLLDWIGKKSWASHWSEREDVCGPSSATKDKAEVWYMAGDDFNELAKQGHIFDRPVIIKQKFTKSKYGEFRQQIMLRRQEFGNRLMEVQNTTTGECSVLSWKDYGDYALSNIDWSSQADTAKIGNAYNVAARASALVRRKPPLLTEVPRFSLARSLQYLLDPDYTGVGPTPAEGVETGPEHDLITFTGSFSFPRTEDGCGSWTRCLNGSIIYLIVPRPSEHDWDSFARKGHAWSPGGKSKMVLLTPGDVFFMPPGQWLIHAWLTLEPTILEGSTLWDVLAMPKVLKDTKWAAEHQNCVQAPQFHVYPRIIDGLEQWAKRDLEWLKKFWKVQTPPGYRSVEEYLAAILKGVEELRTVKCDCEVCDETCPCGVAYRSCTSWCKGHPDDVPAREMEDAGLDNWPCVRGSLPTP